MKVFLTGATGAIGAPTVQALRDAGHDVRAVARDETKAGQLRTLGAEPTTVDLFDADAVRSATAGCEAIAHLATNVPPMSRMARRNAWATHNQLRTDATRNLLDAAAANGISTFVKESVVFTYPDRGDEWIDESVPVTTGAKLLEPTLDGERLVTDFSTRGGRGVVLRFGLFYGPTSRSVDESLRLARWRGSSVTGRPSAYQSSIHTADVATAVVAALDAAAGVYNVVDDDPVTRREYLDAFSAAFGLPRLRPTPAAIVRLVAGSGASALVASQRCANGRFRGETGWAPGYPSVREGWPAVAAARADAVSSQ
jgi:nucleoside-diphosphate-sugar epimerase